MKTWKGEPNFKASMSMYHFYLCKKDSCTFWLNSSSLSLACSCCIWLSSSCWLWRRSCISKVLLPIDSTGEFSALRVSALRPNLPELIISRSKGLLGRDEFRTKSNVNADPKESENEVLHHLLLFSFVLACDSLQQLGIVNKSNKNHSGSWRRQKHLEKVWCHINNHEMSGVIKDNVC